MLTRQSGAAHVPIMFFLILLVFFLGTLGFAWVTLNENNQLRQEADQARANVQAANARSVLFEHYVTDLGRVVGKPGPYEGRAQSKPIYEGQTIAEVEGIMNPDDVRQVMANACAAAKVGEGTNLESVLGSLVNQINMANDRTANAETARDKALADAAAANQKFNELKSETDRKAREWSQNLDQARTDYNNGLADKDRTIANLQQNLKDKDSQLIDAKEAAAQREKELLADISMLQNHNSALASRENLRLPANSPDGKVIAARNGVRTAFINLGKKDLLQPDTMFRIKNPNSDKVKGYARVLRVEEERAEVELSNVVDPVGDYVREGDLLYNNLYTPGMTRTIYLMGRFSAPYNKDTLATLLTRLGNKVVDKMAPGVDTVIVGNDLPTEENDGFAPIEDRDRKSVV